MFNGNAGVKLGHAKLKKYLSYRTWSSFNWIICMHFHAQEIVASFLEPEGRLHAVWFQQNIATVPIPWKSAWQKIANTRKWSLLEAGVFAALRTRRIHSCTLPMRWSTETSKGRNWKRLKSCCLWSNHWRKCCEVMKSLLLVFAFLHRMLLSKRSSRRGASAQSWL